DGTLNLVELQTGKLAMQLKRPPGNVRFAFSPDSKMFLLSTLDDNRYGVTLYRVKEAPKKVADIKPREVHHQDWPRAMNTVAVFTPDGTRYLVAGNDPDRYETVMYLWDVKTGKLLQQLTMPRCVVQTAIFTPDGGQLLTAQHDAKTGATSLRLWSVKTGRQI